MARYKDTVSSSRSQEDTFDYLARFSNTEDWDPGAVRGRDLQDGGAIGVGSRFSLDFKIGGKEQELVYETYDADVALRGPLKLLDPLMTAGFKKVAGKAAEGLEETLNSPASRPA